MAPVIVQVKQNFAAAASVTVTLTNPTTAGNCLVVAVTSCWATTNAHVSGITLGGAAGNFGQLFAEGTSGGQGIVAFWADPNCAGGQTSVAVSSAGGVGTAALSATVYEVSGLPTTFSTLLDKSSGNTTVSGGTTFTSNATPSTTVPAEFWIGAVVVGFATSTIAGPAGPWANQAQQGAGGATPASMAGAQVASSTGAATYSGTITGSNDFTAAVLTLAGGTAPTVTASWTSGHARIPTVYAADAPALTPLAVPVTNTAGQWLFAVASWRQDAGTSGILPYPSTVSVSDDAHNFWIPVYAGAAPPAPTVSVTYVTPGLVQSTSATGTTTPLALTLGTPTTAGNTLIVAVSATGSTSNPTVSGITIGGSASNFHNSVSVGGGVNPADVEIWECFNVPGGQTAISISFAGGVGSFVYSAEAMEWSGLLSTGATDQTTANTNSSSSATFGTGNTGTLAQATEVAIGIGHGAATGIVVTGPGSPWFNFTTVGPSGNKTIVGYNIVTTTSPQSYSGTYSPNSAASTAIATFRAAVQTGPPTGIVRCSVWMAPAARQAQFVFFSPTAYQAGLAVQIFQFTGACPWYQVQAVTGAFTNQGVSLSAMTVTPAAGIFALGVVAWDNINAGATINATGWTALSTNTVTNGTDHTGDIFQAPYMINGTGSAASLSVTGSFLMDLAGVIVVVSGVSDARAYPYGTPALENWPVLVTEIGAGPALNPDPVFAQGTTFWTTNSVGSVTATTAVQWSPIPDTYQPQLYGSVLVAYGGGGLTPQLQSNLAALPSISVPYTAIAWVYSPNGFGIASLNTGISVGIGWWTAGSVSISTIYPPAYTVVQAGEWTQLTLAPVFPPSNAAFGTVTVTENGGAFKPVLSQFYVAYAAFGPADAYEGTSPDQVAWTDISSRMFTQGQVEVTRGIQYEQQSLEAGTMTFHADNHDGLFTFGNVLSLFYPNTGDTDVPIRLRAIWAGSLTPYAVLFSGYTDDIIYGVDPETYYGFAEIQSSDAWSRLTQQMLALVENEALIDNPVALISCNQTGGNTISTGSYNVGVQSILSSIDQDMLITAPSATFSGGAINIAGSAGLSCWQSSGTKAAASDGNIGYALVWPLQVPLPVTQGVTVEFWWCPVSPATAQANGNVLICGANATAGYALAWVITAQNTTPAQSYINYFNIQTFDRNGNTVSNQAIGTAMTPYLTAVTAARNYYFTVTWNLTSITIAINPGGGLLSETITLAGQNFASSCGGFWWGGGLNVHSNYGDSAVADIAVYNYSMPPTRSASRYQAGVTAFAGESDVYRLARVLGYSGFVPVVGMRGIDLAVPPAADVDMVTGATDTNTQVASAYFTNIAASTLAAMFVNGPGTLIYRRRNEWYNRPIGQYVLGELDFQGLSLHVNPLNASASTAGWAAQNGATLTTSSLAAGGPLFNPYCGVFHGNGVTLNPQIGYTLGSFGVPATPGNYYSLSLWVYSPQGFAGGLGAYLQFYNSIGGSTGFNQYNLPALAAGQLAYMTISGRAPGATAFVTPYLFASGTPSASVQFYVANVQVSQVNPDYAPGPNVAVPEAPYAADYQLSSDRAQLYNYSILTQYGTNLVSSFSGTSVLFTPSSGVIVLTSNLPSIAQRGQIPYTATIYEDNTAQASPYYLNEGSIEDVGSWIVQTLGSPLFRPDKITLTPAATPASTITGAFAEVGDTVVFRRRPFGSPAIQVLTYISKLTHTIDISTGTWTVAYELSPFPGGDVLTADDVVHGILTGQQQLGW